MGCGEDADLGRVREGRPFKGTLSTVGATAAGGAGLQTAQDKAFSRLAVYASLKADEDTRDAKDQGMKDQVIQLAAAFGTEWAFVEPEILAMDPATLDGWIASTPGLKGLHLLPARRDPTKGAYAQCHRRSADGADWADDGRER